MAAKSSVMSTAFKRIASRLSGKRRKNKEAIAEVDETSKDGPEESALQECASQEPASKEPEPQASHPECDDFEEDVIENVYVAEDEFLSYEDKKLLETIRKKFSRKVKQRPSIASIINEPLKEPGYENSFVDYVRNYNPVVESIVEDLRAEYLRKRHSYACPEETSEKMNGLLRSQTVREGKQPSKPSRFTRVASYLKRK